MWSLNMISSIDLHINIRYHQITSASYEKMEALHLQSASFASRLNALEKQQDLGTGFA